MPLIALGANLPSAAGSPRETLEMALAALDAHGVTTVARSAWYRTPAYPAGAGPDYVNGVAKVACRLAPADLLALLQKVEAVLGRRRGQRWGPRVCDLDLVAWGDTVLPDKATVRGWVERTGDARLELPPGLILPHPRMHERGFVLLPLTEVAPDWRHPLIGATASELLAALPPDALAGIERL